ncbi:MAG: helix-turn-helix transcriptional regulator, partial [Pyrinomonadaceae bacterium]|nr:helix-turn-helix transcriptional regulator [Pyrinomonadaceae bacterium]
GLTVEDVAARAGVSRLTVYNHFESKAGLLEALAWSLFERADISLVRHARKDPDVTVALRGFVAANAQFLSSFGAQGRAILSAASLDPELRAVVDATYNSGRRAAIVELVERVDDAGRLRPGWSRDRAVASLMVLTSLEAFATLVETDGWDVSDAGSLLAEMAAAAVLGA